MLSSLAFKLIAGAVGIAAVLGAAAWFYNHVENVGYARAHTEQLEAAIAKEREGRTLRAQPVAPDDVDCWVLPRTELPDRCRAVLSPR